MGQEGSRRRSRGVIHLDEPSRTEVLVIGNSHTKSIEAALTDKTRKLVEVVNLATYFDPVNRRNKVLPPIVVDMFQPERIYCSFGGSEYSVFGLLEAPVRFDFMTASDSSVEPGREVIPYALVKATLERAMRRAIGHTRDLRALFQCPITHVCTPPPFRAVAEGARLPTVFQANLHLGISPASIRMKLYELYNEIARETYVPLGVDILGVPPGCTDEDGFLLAEFCSVDPTHANERYGELVLRQILGD
jgi:hypothetical protein